MKKVFATILAFVYLSTSMGATVHLHYCMGKLFSWSLTNKDNKDCEACGMPKHNVTAQCKAFKASCCKDKHTRIQIDKDQKTSETAYESQELSFVALPGTFPGMPDAYISLYIAGYPTTNAPPDREKVPLFIRYCHFRI